jgi:CheY-like chemotaxis protein
VFYAPGKKSMTQPETNGGEGGDTSKPLIFAVDDEPMLLELVVAILEPQGYRVRTFRDPGIAVRAFTLTAPPPALIISDYSMHNMTGLDLIRECRRINSRQKIILVSGTVDERIFAGAAEKPDCFLAKPYQGKQLADLVHAVLSS